MCAQVLVTRATNLMHVCVFLINRVWLTDFVSIKAI